MVMEFLTYEQPLRISLLRRCCAHAQWSKLILRTPWDVVSVSGEDGNCVAPMVQEIMTTQAVKLAKFVGKCRLRANYCSDFDKFFFERKLSARASI